MFAAPSITIISSWSNDTQSPTQLDLSLVGPASDGGIAAFLHPLPFSVVYNCSSTGSAVIQVSLALPPFDTCLFQWTKHCGRTPRATFFPFHFSVNLSSLASVHRAGFNIGTIPNGDNVVSDGHVTLAYSRAAHVAFVMGSVQQTRFYITQMPSAGQPATQAITAINLESDSPICSPYFAGTSAITPRRAPFGL